LAAQLEGVQEQACLAEHVSAASPLSAGLTGSHGAHTEQTQGVQASAQISSFGAISWLPLDRVLSELAETQCSSQPSDTMPSAGQRRDEGKAKGRGSSLQRAPFRVVPPPSLPAFSPLEKAAAAARCWEEPRDS